jgi:leader peptidase (prepilin peptidase) / N-methyltransferase
VLVLRAAAAALLGLPVGSFLTVVAHRMPRGESVVAPRSRCPSCGTQIRARDNIPVLSYVFLRGRCRRCGARISPVYPLVELATGALFALAAVVHESLVRLFLVAPFLAVMVAVAVIDAQRRIIPNRIIYPALLVYAPAIVLADLLTDDVQALGGAVGLVAYAGPLFLIALVIPQGMGMGDVKLAALIGLVLGSLGPSYVLVAAGLGVIGGGVGALLAVMILGYGRRQNIPFGPFMAAGAALAALVAPEVADLYLSLFGVA